MMTGRRVTRARIPQPPETKTQHTGIEPEVGQRDAGIRHVEETVLQHEGALRTNEVLEPEASLGAELETTGQLRNSVIERRAQDSATQIEKGH